MTSTTQSETRPAWTNGLHTCAHTHTHFLQRTFFRSFVTTYTFVSIKRKPHATTVSDVEWPFLDKTTRHTRKPRPFSRTIVLSLLVSYICAFSNSDGFICTFHISRPVITKFHQLRNRLYRAIIQATHNTQYGGVEFPINRYFLRHSKILSKLHPTFVFNLFSNILTFVR